MEDLSQSYERTLGLLDAKKQKEALAEFHNHFFFTVKKLYSEMATTCPEKFSKSKDWCKWARDSYTLTVRTHQALQSGSSADALDQLDQIRQHFLALHEQTETCRSNDYIYSMLMILEKEKPEADQLAGC